MNDKQQSPIARLRAFRREAPLGMAALRAFAREQLIAARCLRTKITEGVDRVGSLCSLTESGEAYLRHSPKTDLLTFIRSKEFKEKNPDLFDEGYDAEELGSLDLSKLSPLEKLKLARRRRAAGTDF